MSEKPKFTVNNGARADIAFGKYIGKAGVVEKDGTARIAFFAEFRDMRDVKSGTIDGKLHRVASVERSDPAKGGVKGMVVLTVTPADTQGLTAVTQQA